MDDAYFGSTKISFETFTINNVKYCHYKKQNSPLALSLISNSGSRYDPENLSGLAHLLEHMLFEGSEKFSTKNDLSTYVEDYGGKYGASTSLEDTKIDFIFGDSSGLSIVNTVLDQILNHNSFNRERLESEKKVIYTEIASKTDRAARVIANNIRNLMYGDCGLSRNISGSEDTVAKITIEDVANRCNQTLLNNLTVVSCGDIDLQEIVDSLGTILTAKPFSIIPETFNPTGTKTGATKIDNQKLINCQIAFKTDSMSSADYVPLRVIASYLGQSRTSVLTKTLREKHGLLYSISCGNKFYSDTGYLHIDFSTTPENLNYVVEKITESIDLLAAKGINSEDLARLINRTLLTSKINMQTAQSWVDFQAYKEVLVKRNPYNYFSLLEEVIKVTPNQLSDTARKYFRSSNRYSWVYGDMTQPLAK